MKKLIAVLLVVFTAQITLYAQQQDTSIFKGGAGYVFAGVSFLNTSSLDKSLGQYGLPKFGSGEMSLTFGGGGGTFLKRIYFGGYGAAQVGLSASNDQYQTKVNGGYGIVHIGYALLHKASAALYPTFGIGGGGSAMRIDAGHSFSGNTNSLLLQPGSRIHTGYMLLDLGFNGDFPVSSGKSTKGRFLLGFSVGYQLAPFVSKWEFNDQSLSELEKFNPSGFYLKVKLGYAKNYPK